MDIWGVGCVFFEMLSLMPLFPGNDEIDQVNKIHYILGSPPEEIFNKLLSKSVRNDIIYEKQNGTCIKTFLPNASNECIDLIQKMLIYDPEKRITAKQALNHPYFKDLYEQEQRKMMSLNDSISFIKGADDSMFMNKKPIKRDSNGMSNYNINNNNTNKKETILPNIKVYNYSIMEDSENENSKQNINNQAFADFVKLPRLNFQFGKEKGNYLNSNEFKSSLKHNLSNHSIDNILNNNITHYKKGVKQYRKLGEIRRNYVSPYSKKIIQNIIQI
jgi:renal tumor antigen